MWKALDVAEWKERRRADLAGVREAVAGIVEAVDQDGDEALYALTKKFDRIELEDLAVAPEEFEAAYDEVDEALVDALADAEANIRRFHELQRNRSLWLEEVEPGVVLGVKTTPLDRVGAYVPGGRAAYPSTALMTTVPAQVAGVEEICVCSPPPIHPLTLVALDLAGVDECYRIGGAQAIAAMALGTETIDPVQKIVGPGNVFVTAAKMMLRDHAEIDFPAGPSEIGVLADTSADPVFVAADVLAQAEHDPHAGCVLVTTDPTLPARVGAEIRRQLETAERREIIEAALKNSGYVVAADFDEAVVAMDEIAPEHLSIQVADPMAALNAVHHAGSIFVGPYTAVAFGDYASGTNHVLPTAGYARTYSGLDIHHFCKTSSVQMLSREGAEALGDIVESLATAEGLHAHANSVRLRRQRRK
ncbi:histidinol dehydrogenase [Methanofollis formosanus]|uniref:Histidinol dehydrogenase n=1 Tax=Methanofollis formosanus TaxID=299308 RepID=A0A8G1A1V0_9EURY|nr:histidinol dehydrogenase [Methanofollis formosanus]QYZ78552.1 histidinol dehydrogenase [Methanofollis formosanus]